MHKSIIIEIVDDSMSVKPSQNEIKEGIKDSYSSKKFIVIDPKELKDVKIPEFDADIHCLVEPNVEQLVEKTNNTMVYLIFMKNNYF